MKNLFQSLEYEQEKRVQAFGLDPRNPLIFKEIVGGADGTRTSDPRRDRQKILQSLKHVFIRFSRHFY